jgi:hypothetical protein
MTKEELKQYWHDYRKKNADRYAEYQKNRYWRLRQQLLDKFGEKCVKCGSTKQLEMHHVNGYPHSGRRTESNIIKEITRALKGDDKIEILCHKCHRT